MSEFKSFTSASGVLSVQHGATHILVHSAANPLKEAADSAASLTQSSTAKFILIGVGLGYLATELAKSGRLHECYEPFAELHHIRESYQSDNALEIMVGDAADLVRDFLNDEPPAKTEIVIAPYVRALSRFLDDNLQEIINRLQVVSQSRKLYVPMIERNLVVNRSQWEKIPRLNLDSPRWNKPTIAFGAGPSLDLCVQAVRSSRKELQLVAASGALPALSAANIVPDWTVALEARDTVLTDLECATIDQQVVVFPWTHPAVLRQKTLRHFAADESTLNTDSGTSALTAADLALKLTSGPLFLIGMELSNSQGAYASNVNRLSSDVNLPAPKYQVMRNALHKWAHKNASRTILHVLPDDVAPVSGVQHIRVSEFLRRVATLRHVSNFAPLA